MEVARQANSGCFLLKRSQLWGFGPRPMLEAFGRVLETDELGHQCSPRLRWTHRCGRFDYSGGLHRQS